MIFVDREWSKDDLHDLTCIQKVKSRVALVYSSRAARLEGLKKLEQESWRGDVVLNTSK